MPNYNHPSLSDPNVWATRRALQDYPWLRRMGVPIDLTTGKGPFMSESYDPKAEENPYPGHFTVQLRNQRLVNDPSQWPSALGREGMDYMARHDPTYQSTAQQFRHEMSNKQLDTSYRRYLMELGQGEQRPYEKFLQDAELQEFIGGYVFNMPGWSGYTKPQTSLLDSLKDYMWQGQKPTSLSFKAEGK